jgi:hypothetical protein
MKYTQGQWTVEQDGAGRWYMLDDSGKRSYFANEQAAKEYVDYLYADKGIKIIITKAKGE